jgi:L-threonylcarbamoyladenylate synthase
MQVSLSQLLQAARQGSVVSFPTDTLPALAVRPDRAELLYQIKQRETQKPLILMAASSIDLWPFTVGDSTEQKIWQTMADRYWPGGLTMVLPASDRVPPGLNLTDQKTIGLRVPNSAIARDILEQTGVLATSSANLSGQPALLTANDIAGYFPTVAVLGIDGAAGQPSTVIEWRNGDWQLLRAGIISITDVRVRHPT